MSNNASLAPVAVEGAPPAFTRQGGPSTMEVHAGPAPRRITLPFTIPAITMTQNTRHVDFSDIGALPMFQMFESVRLLDMSFTVVVIPGSTKVLYYRIDESSTSSSDTIVSMSGPISGLVPGAQYGYTVQEIPLPTNHSFGRELKATAIGNGPPRLHLYYTGGTASATTPDIKLRGSLTLELSGVGVTSAINL